MRASRGSALILTVVLTSLLAIVGVLFLMATRIDRMASSASVDSRELTFAVNSIVTRINDELARDVPGGPDSPEYHDYPDANDPWLADLEPYRVFDPNAAAAPADANQFFWRQISDVTGLLGRSNRENVPVKPSGRTVIEEYARSDLVSRGQMADADGDGIADSKWVEWLGLTSSKGRPIYAAIRIIDNGGMLNVNTADTFNPTPPAAKDTDVDGHTQLQVNLGVLGAGVNRPGPGPDRNRYEREVIWKYGLPGGGFVPFDIADELELRYRYCIDGGAIRTRVENTWTTALGSGNPQAPYDASSGHGLLEWCLRVPGAIGGDGSDRRHLLTTYNMDRILMPKRAADPNRMVSINTADEERIAHAVRAALAGVNLAAIAPIAQIVVNLKDYIDDDCTVTVRGEGSSAYYGFEPPCIYISELVWRLVRDPINPQVVRRSYAVELFKPYFEDRDPGRDPLAGEWRLTIDNPQRPGDPDVNETITWSGTRRFHVLLAESTGASLQGGYLRFSDDQEPADTTPYGYDRAAYAQPSAQSLDAAGFSERATIKLQRKVVKDLREEWRTMDSTEVPAGWMVEDGAVHSLQRDISVGKCIFRLWNSARTDPNTPVLGNGTTGFASPDPRKLQAHPANRPLRNIGELGMVFAWSADGITGKDPRTPEGLLIDLRNPIYARLLNYLTVMDPAAHGADPNEMRIKGRVNINTAPALVLAQLPWMQYPDSTIRRSSKIVEHRAVYGAFKSTAGLMQVAEMCELADPNDKQGGNSFEDTPRGPDLTRDAVVNDLEERDLIFTRISDLVTVRSDVFTAYILVRIGVDGPQKRVIAILDRSEVVFPGDPVRIVALQQVPDPQ